MMNNGVVLMIGLDHRYLAGVERVKVKQLADQGE